MKVSRPLVLRSVGILSVAGAYTGCGASEIATSGAQALNVNAMTMGKPVQCSTKDSTLLGLLCTRE